MNETDEPREAAREWLLRAEEDLRAAELLLAQDEPLVGPAGFHAQQAAEKALKGYLASRSRPIRRTHDLVDLVNQCGQDDPAFLALAPQASGLAPYAVQARYPDTPFSATADEASLAVRTASGIVRFVRLRVKQK